MGIGATGATSPGATTVSSSAAANAGAIVLPKGTAAAAARSARIGSGQTPADSAAWVRLCWAGQLHPEHAERLQLRLHGRALRRGLPQRIVL